MLVAAAACAARAQAPAQWYVQVDNDVLYGTDRWYTSGVRLARVEPRGGHAIEWGVLQEIYTPDARRHDRLDRPPAARLLAVLARHDRGEGTWRTLEADVGVNGPAALGREAQDLIHRLVPAPHEEWHVQRDNRFDGSLVVAGTRRLGAPAGDDVRLNAHYGVVAGTLVAFAHAGLELRVGRGAAAALSSPVLRFAATPPLPAGAGAQGGWSAFAGVSVRAYGRNRLLERNPAYPGPTLERRDAVTRLAAGVTWIGRGASVVFAMVRDGRAFEGQRRPHGFGSIALHVPF